MVKLVYTKIDVRGTIKQIQKIETEDCLFAFSRKLRMYYDQGLISIPDEIREEMNDKLDKIYRNQ